MKLNRKTQLFLLVVSFFAFNTTIFSQEDPNLMVQESGSKSYISLNGGVNLSNLKSELHYSNYKLGPAFGINVGTSIGNHFFIESGINYTSKGLVIRNFPIIQIAEGSTDSYSKYRQSLNYVSAPLSIGVSFGNKVQFIFKQGVGFDLLVGKKGELIGRGNIDHPEAQPVIIGLGYRDYDISLNGAAGINIPVGRYFLGGTVNYNLGLLNLEPDNNYTNHTKNRTFGLNFHVGYRF